MSLERETQIKKAQAEYILIEYRICNNTFKFINSAIYI